MAELRAEQAARLAKQLAKERRRQAVIRFIEKTAAGRWLVEKYRLGRELEARVFGPVVTGFRLIRRKLAPLKAPLGKAADHAPQVVGGIIGLALSPIVLVLALAGVALLIGLGATVLMGLAELVRYIWS